MSKYEKYAVLLLFIILFSIRLYHINTPPIEIEESWRQGDTESIARNFVEYDFNIFHPNFNYDGPLPNIPALEIQVTTFLIAILYKFFGYKYMYARIVPICFFLLSAFYVYLFSKKYMDKFGAFFSTAFYGFFPINIYYSRAIMPESAGLFFFISALYYFDLWFDHKKDKLLFISALLTSLAIMTKPPTIFIGLPMLFLCYRNMGFKWLKNKKLWIFATSIISISLIYYCYSISIAELKFSLGLTKNLFMNSFPHSLINEKAGAFFLKQIPKAFYIHSIILLIIGLFYIEKKQFVLFIFFISMALETLLVVSNIRVTYYLIFFTVPCSIIIGNVISKLLKIPIINGFILLWIFFIFNSSLKDVKPMYTINETMKNQISVVAQTIDKDDLIIAGSIDPCILSISGRKGWRFNKNYGLDYYIEKGAKYFVPIKEKIYSDEDKNLLNYLESKYKRIESIKGYPIYKLQ